MSKLLLIVGAVLGFITFLTALATIISIFLAGTAAGLSLLFTGLGIDAGEYYYKWAFMLLFVEIGVPVMGGLWLFSFLMLPTVVPPLILAILALVGALLKKGKGKIFYIISIVLATLALVSNYAVVPGIIILIGSVAGLVSVGEEKAKMAEEQPKEEALEVETAK